MRRRRSLLPVVSVVTFMFGAIAVAFVGGFRLNLTPSEPLGLWRIQPLHRTVSAGALVFAFLFLTVLKQRRRAA